MIALIETVPFIDLTPKTSGDNLFDGILPVQTTDKLLLEEDTENVANQTTSQNPLDALDTLPDYKPRFKVRLLA